MKTVASDSLLCKGTGKSEKLFPWRHVSMEGRIKTRDLGYVRPLRDKDINGLQGMRLMQRHQFNQVFQPIDHRFIYAYGLGIGEPAMHDTMADGADR